MAAHKPKIVYWKPGMAVRGQRVYLDANFLVALAWPDHIWHTSAGGLRDALTERATGMVLSSLAFNEAVYQLLRLVSSRGGPAGAEVEDGSPDETGWSERLDRAVLELPNLTFFEPADAAFQRQIIQAVRGLNLDPTDAFHYAAAGRLACPLVSNDTGFQKLPDRNLTIVTFY